MEKWGGDREKEGQGGVGSSPRAHDGRLRRILVPTFGSQIVASPASTPYATQMVPEHSIDAYGVAVKDDVVPSIWIFLIASIGERKTSCEAIGGVHCMFLVC